jgi:CRP-like cAMP-binding protein
MALDDDIDVLSRQPLLGLLPREALRLLAFASETRILRAGDILFRKGEPAEGGHLIVRGTVMLDTREDAAAGQRLVGPGVLLGEMALFSAVTRPATAIAREPTTLSHLPRSVMRRVLGEFPDAAIALREAIAGRVSQFAEHIAPVGDRIRALD